MARITLDLPDELVSELERRADRRGVSASDFVCRILELNFPRIPRRTRVDISNRSEVQERSDFRTRVGENTRAETIMSQDSSAVCGMTGSFHC